jgi:deoxyadenosine/deoxycytidine kinase
MDRKLHRRQNDISATSNNSAKSSNRASRIEICGGIASGKTTLAALLQRSGYNAVFENFTLNPFIEKFYSDPVFYSFETELSFLLQHYSQIKTEARQTKEFICDYSLLLDSSYAKVTLNPVHLKIFHGVHEAIISEIGYPTFVIYLKCASTTQLYRIGQRHRGMESGISIQYLDQLNYALEHRVRQERDVSKTLEIDSERINFAEDSEDRFETVKLIRETFSI